MLRRIGAIGAIGGNSAVISYRRFSSPSSSENVGFFKKTLDSMVKNRQGRYFHTSSSISLLLNTILSFVFPFLISYFHFKFSPFPFSFSFSLVLVFLFFGVGVPILTSSHATYTCMHSYRERHWHVLRTQLCCIQLQGETGMGGVPGMLCLYVLQLLQCGRRHSIIHSTQQKVDVCIYNHSLS